MIAAYAFAVSKLISDLMYNADVTESDLKYLHIKVYPVIADAMWKGVFRIEMPSSRLTDGIRRRLFDQGFVLKPSPNTTLRMTICWANQTVDDVNGQPTQVSSTEFNAFLGRLDDDLVVERIEKRIEQMVSERDHLP